jgi:hypothetical protein
MGKVKIADRGGIVFPWHIKSTHIWQKSPEFTDLRGFFLLSILKISLRILYMTGVSFGRKSGIT